MSLRYNKTTKQWEDVEDDVAQNNDPNAVDRNQWSIGENGNIHSGIDWSAKKKKLQDEQAANPPQTPVATVTTEDERRRNSPYVLEQLYQGVKDIFQPPNKDIVQEKAKQSDITKPKDVAISDSLYKKLTPVAQVKLTQLDDALKSLQGDRELGTKAANSLTDAEKKKYQDYLDLETQRTKLQKFLGQKEKTDLSIEEVQSLFPDQLKDSAKIDTNYDGIRSENWKKILTEIHSIKIDNFNAYVVNSTQAMYNTIHEKDAISNGRTFAQLTPEEQVKIKKLNVAGDLYSNFSSNAAYNDEYLYNFERGVIQSTKIKDKVGNITDFGEVTNDIADYKKGENKDALEKKYGKELINDLSVNDSAYLTGMLMPYFNQDLSVFPESFKKAVQDAPNDVAGGLGNEIAKFLQTTSKAVSEVSLTPSVAYSPGTSNTTNEAALEQSWNKSPMAITSRYSNIVSTGLVGGVSLGLLKPQPKEEPSNVAEKFVYQASNALGSVVTIGGIAKKLAALGEGSAVLTDFAKAHPTAYSYLQNATTFAAAGQVDPDVKDRWATLAKDLSVSVPFSAVGNMSASKSIPLSFTFGYIGGKLDGASEEDALTAGFVNMGVDAMMRMGHGSANEKAMADGARITDQNLRAKSLKNFSEITGIEVKANTTPEELKQLYREASKKLNTNAPGERNGLTQAEREINQAKINAAYDYLTRDPIQAKSYEETWKNNNYEDIKPTQTEDINGNKIEAVMTDDDPAKLLKPGAVVDSSNNSIQEAPITQNTPDLNGDSKTSLMEMTGRTTSNKESNAALEVITQSKASVEEKVPQLQNLISDIEAGKYTDNVTDTTLKFAKAELDNLQKESNSGTGSSVSNTIDSTLTKVMPPEKVPSYNQAIDAISGGGGFAHIDKLPLAQQNAYAAREIGSGLNLNSKLIYQKATEQGYKLTDYLKKIDRAETIDQKVQLGDKLLDTLLSPKSEGSSSEIHTVPSSNSNIGKVQIDSKTHDEWLKLDNEQKTKIENIPSNLSPSEVKSYQKGVIMDYAVKKRELLGTLTQREKDARIKVETGDKVTVNGKEYKVKNPNAFGAVSLVDKNNKKLTVQRDSEPIKNLLESKRSELDKKYTLAPAEEKQVLNSEKASAPVIDAGSKVSVENSTPAMTENNTSLAQPLLSKEAPISQGQNKLKESKAFTRIEDQMTPEEIKKYKPYYETMNMTENNARALLVVEDDFTRAKRIALGYENPPEGVTEVALMAAVAAKAKAEGDRALWSTIEQRLTLKGTRAGQEIVSFRGRLDKSQPADFIAEVMERKMEAKFKQSRGVLSKFTGNNVDGMTTPKQKAIAAIDQEIKKTKEIIDKKTIKLKSAQDIIDLLTCKI